jgi:hypothetical protein
MLYFVRRCTRLFYVDAFVVARAAGVEAIAISSEVTLEGLEYPCPVQLQVLTASENSDAAVEPEEISS